MAKKRIQLVDWDGERVKQRATDLRAAGYTVLTKPPNSPAAIRAMADKPPAATVIDLSRAPSHGRDVALAIRQRKALRGVPLVFVGGATDNTKAIGELLPGATFTTWRGVRKAIERAMAKPVDHAPPPSAVAGYSGTPLPKKLGIKEGTTVVTVGAPADFPATLGALPTGARLRTRNTGARDLTIWFPRSLSDLMKRIGTMKQHGAGGLWIAWPKKSSGVKTDLDGNVVRRTGLANDLVDYKVCAIDATYSGLKFSARKARK